MIFLSLLVMFAENGFALTLSNQKRGNFGATFDAIYIRKATLRFFASFAIHQIVTVGSTVMTGFDQISQQASTAPQTMHFEKALA